MPIVEENQTRFWNNRSPYPYLGSRRRRFRHPSPEDENPRSHGNPFDIFEPRPEPSPFWSLDLALSDRNVPTEQPQPEPMDVLLSTKGGGSAEEPKNRSILWAPGFDQQARCASTEMESPSSREDGEYHGSNEDEFGNPDEDGSQDDSDEGEEADSYYSDEESQYDDGEEAYFSDFEECLEEEEEEDDDDASTVIDEEPQQNGGDATAAAAGGPTSLPRSQQTLTGGELIPFRESPWCRCDNCCPIKRMGRRRRPCLVAEWIPLREAVARREQTKWNVALAVVFGMLVVVVLLFAVNFKMDRWEAMAARCMQG